MQSSNHSGFAKFVSMIDAIHVGMLTSVDEEGELRARPMATMKVGEGSVWFFTSVNAPKVKETSREAKVNVTYSDPNTQVYVSVSGHGMINQDKSLIRQLWTDEAARWFPRGVDDPSIAVMEIKITEAEYWDVDTASMARLIGQGAKGEELAKATEHKKVG